MLEGLKVYALQACTESFALMNSYPKIFVAPVIVAGVLSVLLDISTEYLDSNKSFLKFINYIFYGTLCFVSLNVANVTMRYPFSLVGILNDEKDMHRAVAYGLVGLLNLAVLENKTSGSLIWVIIFTFFGSVGLAFIEGGASHISFPSEEERSDWSFSVFLIIWSVCFYSILWISSHWDAIMYNLTIPIWFTALVGGLYILPFSNGMLLAIVLLLGFPVVLAIQYHKGVNSNIVTMYVQGVKLLPNIITNMGRLFGRQK